MIIFIILADVIFFLTLYQVNNMFNLQAPVLVQLKHLNSNNYRWIVQTWTVRVFHPIRDISTGIANS